MATKLYPLGKSAFAKAQIDLIGHDIRVFAVDVADYTYSDTHEFLSDVPSGARVANASLTGNAVLSGGVFDADDATLLSVSGDPFEALVLVDYNGGADTARRLIAYIDEDSDGTGGFAVTPDGGNIVITWPSGSDRIFRL